MVSTRIGDFDLGTKKFTATSCAWVDQTEVTFAQYDEFLKDKGAGGGNPTGGDTSIEGCGWNTDATLGKDCLDAELPLQGPGYPVVCIDQCDAAAFCRWAGKELCGGGPQNSPYRNPSFTACTSEGKFSLPYGNLSAGDSKSGKCNDQSYSNKDPACVETKNGSCALKAGTLPSCATATGVADLVGNVYEWTAGCDQSSGQTDQCEVLGGSFNTGVNEAQCDKAIQQPRDARRADIGFRCCAIGKGI